MTLKRAILLTKTRPLLRTIFLMKSRSFLRKFLLMILYGFIFSMNASGQHVFEDSIQDGGNFQKSAFRLWFSNDVETIRGIIVLVPGSNGDGRSLVKDTAWQNLALRHDFALLGCCYKDRMHENMAIEEYAEAGRGSGQALLDVLQNFSGISGHSELAFAPLALWGTSAGGEFNYEFLCWKPERVLAFVVNKGGIYYSSLAPEPAWEVPGIFYSGLEDSPYRNNIIKGIFSINRRFAAKWIFIEETGVAHEFEKSGEFARFYFDNIIPLRISAENSSCALKELPSEGYIGLASTGQILPDTCSVQSEITSWFPTKDIALKWFEFCGY